MLFRYTDLRYFATYKVVHGCGKTFVSKIEIILCILQSRFLDSIKHSPFYPHCRKSFLVSFWERFLNWTQSWMWDKKKLLVIKSVLIFVKLYTLLMSILVQIQYARFVCSYDVLLEYIYNNPNFDLKYGNVICIKSRQTSILQGNTVIAHLL